MVGHVLYVLHHASDALTAAQVTAKLASRGAPSLSTVHNALAELRGLELARRAKVAGQRAGNWRSMTSAQGHDAKNHHAEAGRLCAFGQDCPTHNEAT